MASRPAPTEPSARPARALFRRRRTPRPFGRLRRAVLVRRRLLGALLAVVAVVAAVGASTAPPATTVPVVVATTDLPGGSRVDGADVRVAALPADTVPDGATASPGTVAGRVLAAPLRRGEPVTDVRLVSPGLLTGYPGTVAVPVRLADPTVVELLRVGDHVHLVATSPETGTADVVAEDVPVVALPQTGRDAGATGPSAGGMGPSAALGPVGSDGGLLVVAVDRPVALALAGASATAVMSVLLGR